MNITESLTKLRSDIETADYHEILDLTVDIEAIYDQLNDATDEELALYNKVESEAAVVSRFLSDEYSQLERDQFIDEIRAFNS
jgi:uncharacterized phage infection (PIP) family protein YhgE